MTSAGNAVYYRIPGDPGPAGRDMLLLGTACPCGKEHPGASPGCLGNPAAGCTWAAAPQTDDIAAYGTAEVPLELMTVLDVVDALAPDAAIAAIDASINACWAIHHAINDLDEAHRHQEAEELLGAFDDMRRQTALAAVILGKKLTDSGRDMPVDLWRWLVQLDAAIATDWQVSRRGACVCGRDLDDRGRHDHDPSRPWAAAGRRRHSTRTQNRNEPCACGSGLKYKHCHGR